MIELESVSVEKEGRAILNDLTLSLSEKRIGVIGSNGSGKSTFAKLLNGLEAGFTGSVTVDGLDVRDKNNLGKVGFVFQNPDNQIVFPLVHEDLAFGLKKSGLSKDQINSTIDRYLKTFDLCHLLDRRTHELSGGEKQLVALIGVLVMDPQYIVFDEPTTLLDFRNRFQLLKIIDRLEQPLVVVSHDLDLMASMDRLIWFENGSVVDDGEPQKVLKNYTRVSETASC